MLDWFDVISRYLLVASKKFSVLQKTTMTELVSSLRIKVDQKASV